LATRSPQRVTYRLPVTAVAAYPPGVQHVGHRPDACEIWVGTQVPTRTQNFIADMTGLPKSAVTVHNHYLGGGFGRRLDADSTVLAVKIARHVNSPVKVVWSREEDLQHDLYRPYYYDRMSAGLDVDGHPIAWSHRIVGSSVVARYLPPLYKDGLEFDVIDCAAEIPYACPSRHVEYVRAEPPAVQTAFWRGVGLTHNVFVVESFIDGLPKPSTLAGSCRPTGTRGRKISGADSG
jgi:isoquinoline 1-oxidoreductase beta subunit